jgi:hypothetical protein
MKLALTQEQKGFYQDKGHLTLEGLLSIEAISKIKENIHTFLGNSSAKTRFLQGRDLFRQGEDFKKVILPRKVIELAQEIVPTRPMRLCLDQLLDAGAPIQNGSLQSLFCVQGIKIGVLIALQDQEALSFFPKKAGDVQFLSPDRRISFKQISEVETGSFLLICFGEANCVYIRNMRDSHLHELKKLGYTYGDKLQDATHPIVCR